MTADVSVVILTRNETLHLARAIESVRAFAREVFVIDSLSSDGTQALARAMGAIVLENRFTSHARQFAWALDNAPITSGWILRLDADEVIGADLAATIIDRLPKLADDIVGITFDRRHIFMSRWIRHGGRYPVTLLRLWRRGRGRVEDRWMDEHIEVWGGRTIAFPGTFADANLQDLGFFTAKHNDYATREAVQRLLERHALLAGATRSAAAPPRQARMKRLLKDKVFNRLPFPVASLGYFLYRYVVQLGFLDGREGLIYHVLQGFWYRFLVGAKMVEFERAIAGAADTRAKLAMLAQASGLHLSPDPSVTENK